MSQVKTVAKGGTPPVVALLRKAAGPASDDDTRPIIDNELQVEEHMAAIYRGLQETKATRLHPSFHVIPTFHYKQATLPDGQAATPTNLEDEDERTRAEIRQRMRQLARSRFLRRKEALLPEEEDLSILGRMLEAVHSPPLPPLPAPSTGEGSESPSSVALPGRCNYDDYCQLKEQVPRSTRRFFTVHNFLRFPRDKHGRVSTSDLYRHFYNSVLMEKTKLTLSMYAQEGEGFLTETDLEAYIFDLIPTLPALTGLPENFFPFYVFTAVRRFMFFLDRRRTGRISINKLMRSRVMEELMDLALSSPQAEQELEVSDTFLRQQRAKNWFSSANALRVYSMYLDLDEDHNGLLCRKELLNYSGSTSAVRLTPAFVTRLFEESITYKLPENTTGESEMDYKVFLDFVLAMENKSTPQALHYFFRLLDVDKVGALTGSSIRYLFRDVARRMAECGFEAPNIDDVKDEIFDMAHPQDPSRIALHDFLHCGVGHVIVSILSDVNGFLMYDNRENALYAGEPNDQDDQQGH